MTPKLRDPDGQLFLPSSLLSFLNPITKKFSNIIYKMVTSISDRCSFENRNIWARQSSCLCIKPAFQQLAFYTHLFHVVHSKRRTNEINIFCVLGFADFCLLWYLSSFLGAGLGKQMQNCLVHISEDSIMAVKDICVLQTKLRFLYWKFDIIRSLYINASFNICVVSLLSTLAPYFAL